MLEETGLSDHKPVMMKIKSKVRKWRRQQMRRVPNIRHEKLQEDNAKEEFKRKVSEKKREKST